MYLEKLEIQGFKSFPHLTILKFNRELTAIVGPNGSGKSNIADAIRWVLGEQSLKLLRGKKSEDVIFSGSDKKTRQGVAEVNLYLNNEDNSAPIDFREIVISRRVYRSGEGEYLINKTKVRLIDVQLLLAKANFGQKTYSVIGQGMIEYILTASPQERKEFFDEATGIRQYQIKKDQAINKLVATRENLTQSSNILKEIEPRHRSLTRQVRKLERRIEFENKLRELQKLYFSKLLNDYNSKLKEKDKELEKINSSKVEVEEEVKKINKSIEAEHQAAGREENFDKLQQELIEANYQKNLLLKEKTVAEGKGDLNLIKNGKINLVWLNKRKAELINKENELKKQIDFFKTDYNKKENYLKQKIERQEGLLIDLKKLEEQMITGEDNSEILDQEIVPAFEEIYQIQKSFLQTLESIKTTEEIEEFKKEAIRVKEKIENIYQRIKKFKNKNLTIPTEIKNKVSELKNSQELLNREISQQKIAVSIIEERINLFKENLDDIQKEIKKLEVDEAGMQGSKALINTQDDDYILKEIEEKIKKQEVIIIEIQDKVKNFNKTEDEKKEELFSLQEKLTKNQIKLNQKNETIITLKIGVAKIEAHLEELYKKIKEDWPGHFEPLTEDVRIDLEATGLEIERLKNQLNLIGGLDEGIKDEYNEVSGRYQFLKKEIEDLEEAFVGLEKVVHELNERIKAIFSDNFEKININFSNYFKILFNGGRAKLALIKEKKPKTKPEEISLPVEGEEIADLNEDEDTKKDDWLTKIIGQSTSSNVEIQATPPGKKLSSINVLSGGEKALTSIALICAIINNNPSPFVALDEVDAALDEANSIRFTKILDELAAKTQFICITHNRATIQKAAILYGVTMSDDGVSKILSLNLKEADKYTKN